MDSWFLLKRPFKIPPAVVAFSLQIAAFGCALAIVLVFNLNLAALVFACFCGLLAASFSFLAKQASWWWLIQLLFAPALMATLALNIQPLLFLAGFFVLLLVFWNAYGAQVPLYLSSEKVWLALGNILPSTNTGRDFRFIDIGSGLGGVLTHLAKIRPDGDYNGIESAPLPFLWSWLRIRLGGYRQCRVQWGDLWGCDLSQYDVVFAYLSPAPMERLWQKAKLEMRPGSIFVSSTFAVPGQKPAEIITTDDLHHSSLLIWWM
jgi:SAM-dependent methyltransferase